MARPTTMRAKKRGFTLVELLVVITIIGMLVSLLLPAIQAAREAGRRATCQNNMRQCTLAIMQVAENKRAFPGYANTYATGYANIPYIRGSWVVPILPQLERNDLFQNWQNAGRALTTDAQYAAIPTLATGGVNIANSFYSPMDILLCPSNSTPDLGGNPLSYVVNTGVAKTFNDDPVNPAAFGTYCAEEVNSGVFFSQCMSTGTTATGSWAAVPPTGGIKTNMDFISTRDGTTYTLMLSENLQAANWATDPNDSAGATVPAGSDRGFYNSDMALRENTGMCWFLTGRQNNTRDTSAPSSSGTTTPFAPFQEVPGINDNAQLVTGSIVLSWNMSQSVPSGLAYSRPSANHSGGVNVSYCGGNAGYLSEELDYRVFTQLMTPNQKQVNIAAQGDPVILAGALATDSGWDNTAGGVPFYILDESEF